jgi:small subunit ribosomal protein S20
MSLTKPKILELNVPRDMMEVDFKIAGLESLWLFFSIDIKGPLCYINASLKKGVILVPQRKSGVKELRKNQKRHLRNLDAKTDLKKTVKKFLALVNEKNVDAAKKALSAVFKKFDKAAKRNLIPKNTAARRKSFYSRRLKSIA